MSEMNIYKQEVVKFILLALVALVAPLSIYAQNDGSENRAMEKEVNIAYKNQSKLTSTAAISTVCGDKVKQPTSALSSILAGRIAGLTTVQSSGNPGSDVASLYIRGVGTYNTKNLLVYVDGFPSTIDNLTAYEIESISVLKDAAALAVFGIEGANGVIWVTTKRGTEGPIKVNFQTRYVSNRPIKKMSSMNSYDYARYYNEANSNDKGIWSPIYSDADLQKYKDGSDPVLYPNVNWYNEVMKESTPLYEANLSIRGGNEIVKYGVFLGYQNNEMLFKKNKYNNGDDETTGNYTKYNVRANVDVKINEIFSASAGLGGAIADTKLPYFSTSTLLTNVASYPANIYSVRNPNETWGGSAVYRDNPAASLFATGMSTTHDRSVQANVKLVQNLDVLLKGLKISEAVAFSDYHIRGYDTQREYKSYYPSLDSNSEIVYEEFGENKELDPKDTKIDVWRRFNFYLSADYVRNFGLHDIGLQVSFKQDEYKIDGRPASFFKQGVYGFANYSFDKKYVAEFLYSYSGSENFQKGNRFGFFPTVSGAWVISRESFMESQSWLNLLKLRASTGVVGNDDIGTRFLFQSYFGGNSSNSYVLGPDGKTRPNYLLERIVGNADITWEKSHKTNVGIDLLAMSNKLSVTFDVFYDKRTNIVSQEGASVPSVFGNVLPYENVGKVTNKGFEIELGYKDSFGDFSYALDGMFSFARNKINYQAEEVRSEDYLYRTGHSVGQPFGYVCTGFYEIDDFDGDGNLKEGIPQPSNPVQAGDLKYADLNDDKLINTDDHKAIGYGTIPEITYSFNLGLGYKNFDFNAFFQGVANRSVYVNGVYAWAFQGNTSAPAMAAGRWAYYPDQGIDTRASATYPRLSLDANGNNYTRSTFWTKNGNFLRLRSLELGYTFSSKNTEKSLVKDIRVFIGGSNLLTWSKMDDYDPETIGGYPITKNGYIGINLNF